MQPVWHTVPHCDSDAENPIFPRGKHDNTYRFTNVSAYRREEKQAHPGRTCPAHFWQRRLRSACLQTLITSAGGPFLSHSSANIDSYQHLILGRRRIVSLQVQLLLLFLSLSVPRLFLPLCPCFRTSSSGDCPSRFTPVSVPAMENPWKRI